MFEGGPSIYFGGKNQRVTLAGGKGGTSFEGWGEKRGGKKDTAGGVVLGVSKGKKKCRLRW